MFEGDHVTVDDAEKRRRPDGSLAACTLSSARSTSRATIHGDANGQELVFLAELPEEAIPVDAVDVLHREVRLALVVGARVEDGDDVVVADRRVETRLRARTSWRPSGSDREVRQAAVSPRVGREGPTSGSTGMREIHLRRAADRDTRVEVERAEAGRCAHAEGQERVAISVRYVTASKRAHWPPLAGLGANVGPVRNWPVCLLCLVISLVATLAACEGCRGTQIRPRTQEPPSPRSGSTWFRTSPARSSPAAA